MREIMARASEVVTGGLRIRVDAKIVGPLHGRTRSRYVGSRHGFTTASQGKSGSMRYLGLQGRAPEFQRWGTLKSTPRYLGFPGG
jgi:hypothetical protein